jgi:arabinose-5-phosphate isomerase
MLPSIAMSTRRNSSSPRPRPAAIDPIRRAREIIELEAAGLQKVAKGLNEGFAQAVEAILRSSTAGGKVVVTGIGKNLHIGEKISATLASTGTTSVMLNPAQAMHGDLGILRSGDILLALSYSGESDELINLIPLIRRFGVQVIALTGKPASTLARLCDIVISAAVDREACPFNMAPTTSTTATLAVGDALAMVLLETRGFQIEDYAKLHPGGAIGRTLLLRVADIMRKPDRVASVPAGAKIKDAILAMTQARTGSAAIIDKQGRLLGIFTDGDLRRQLPQHPDLVDLPVDRFMTRSPITVKQDQLAVDVLRTFEQHNIDDLLVLDARRRLVGAIDIQDLPKLKIM